MQTAGQLLVGSGRAMFGINFFAVNGPTNKPFHLVGVID